MSRLLAFVGATIGSSLGWWIGSWVGFATAIILSVIGMAAGLYAGRLTHDQFDSLRERLRSIKSLPAEDTAIVESFVRCARDRDCPPTEP